MATAKDRAKRAVQRQLDRKANSPVQVSAIIGDSDGNVRVPGRPDLIFVRVSADPGKTWKVINDTVADIVDLAVIIEKGADGVWQVTKADRSNPSTSLLGAQGLLKSHHLDHEWLDYSPGIDPVDVHRRAVRPLRTEVSGDTLISRRGVVSYAGAVQRVSEIVDASILSHVPSSGILSVISYLDPRSMTIGYAVGQPVSYVVDAAPILPALPWYAVPQAEIRLYANQDSLSEADVTDFRVNGTVIGVRNNLSGLTAPGVDDDFGAGYSPGSVWVDLSGGDFYICVDATAGAAVWVGGFLSLDAGKVSKLWESDGGAVAWTTDAGGNLSGNGTRTLTAGGDIYAKSNTAGLMFREDAFTTPTDHFSALSGWSWASYTGYATPNTIDVATYPSLLRLRHNNTTDNHFAYRAFAGGFFVTAARLSKGPDSFVGVRADDGTDDNYVEVQLTSSSTTTGAFSVTLRSRTGGGSVTTAEYLLTLTPGWYILQIQKSTSGTTTPFNAFAYITKDTPVPVYLATIATAQTWIISRVGIVFGQRGVASNSDRVGLFDWVRYP